MNAQAQITVGSDHGLHLRPAAELVKTVSGFKADITIVNLSRSTARVANAKSLLEISALGVNQGHVILVRATGEDAHDAIDAVKDLIALTADGGGS